MALWKWVAGAGTATMGIIAAPVADSLVKEGKFPDGLGAVLSTLWSWLTTQFSVPLWLALVIFLPIGISLCGLIMTKRQLLKRNESVPMVQELDQEMLRLSRHNQELTSAKAQLEKQLVAFSEIRREQQNENAALETEIAAQKEANADLQQQLATMSQTTKEAEVEVDMPALAFKVVAAIAMFTNKEIKASLASISTSIGVDQVETHASIDVLRERQIVRHTASARGSYYSLTSKGRAYYLEQKSKSAG